MELRSLRYFSALAHQLHFTAAARSCNVSQSTLSHQIKQLETEIGSKLFDRSTKRPTLTKAGRAFLENVDDALGRIDAGLRRVRDLVAAPEVLQLGIWTNFVATRILPECLKRLAARNLPIHVQVSAMDGGQLLAALDSAAIEIGITSEIPPTRGYRFIPLFMEDLVLSVSAHHPLARRKSLRMIELHRERLVLLTRNFATRCVIDQCLEEAGARPLIVAEMSSPEALVEFARRSDLPIIGPRNALVSTNTVAIPLIPVPVRPMGIILREDRQLPSAANELIDMVKEVWEETQLANASTAPQSALSGQARRGRGSQSGEAVSSTVRKKRRSKR